MKPLTLPVGLACCAGLAALASLLPLPPEAAVGAALSLGTALALRRPSPLLALVALPVALFSPLTSLGLLGLLLGAHVPELWRRPTDRTGRVHTALAGAVLLPAIATSWWLTDALPPAARLALVALALFAALLGAGLPLLLAPSVLLPTERLLRRTLAEHRQVAPRRALAVFQRARRDAPDRSTAHSLEELTAWIYQLALAAEQLEHDLGHLPADLPGQAGSELAHHRQALAQQQQEAEQLSRDAASTLEVVAAGLAVARHNPGEVDRPSLGPLLARLREHGQRREAERRTQRELVSISER